MNEVYKSLRTIISKHVRLSDEVWNKFIDCWEPYECRKNTLITDFGTVERYFYFVFDGLIRGYFIKDGMEYNMGFSYKGDFSGEYESFVNQRPAQFAMESLTDVVALRISHAKLMSMYQKHPEIERWGRLFNEMILSGLGVFIRSIIADTAEERFQRLMSQSPHVIQLIPQKHLASYLGMTPETFSRIRKKWMA